MAAGLNFLPRLCHCGGLSLLLACAVAPAWSEELPDPTRPPEAVSASSVAAAGRPRAAAKSDGLQSVIISPTRRAAIINGSTVELGERFGEARLVEVHEGNVILEGAEGRKVLMLFPDVNIRKIEIVPAVEKAAASPAPAAPAKKASGPKAGATQKKIKGKDK